MQLPSPQILLERWIAALRSGTYRQTKNSLASHVRSAHCCLGVLCEVATQADPLFTWNSNSPYLPVALAEHMGMQPSGEFRGKTVHPETVTIHDHAYYGLVDMNDNVEQSCTFADIADVLEHQPEKVFDWATPKPVTETPPSLIE
jgi:hypothetical protein